MADRGRTRLRNRRATAFAVALTLLCGVLFCTMANGTIFRASNGSSMGLVVGMAAIWVSGIAAFAAWWIAIDPFHTHGPRRESATIHRFALDAQKKDAEKSRDIA